MKRAAQGGFSLIVALMMLVVIIILGISASQMAVNEERGARNGRDRQIAFQAAEAALKDAEYEILNSTSACAVPNQTGRGRAGSSICFNHLSGAYFAPAALASDGALEGDCSSTLPATGLCGYSSTPAYLSKNIDFYGDASGTGASALSGTIKTVYYGQFTGRSFPTQASGGLSGTPVSKYPPRYIIEIVPKNVATSSLSTGCPPAAGICPVMFRVTAMGFGANPNSQVVLQSIVSTQD